VKVEVLVQVSRDTVTMSATLIDMNSINGMKSRTMCS
jgi:hypothetical protein